MKKSLIAVATATLSVGLIAAGPASAQTKSAVTAEELNQVLTDADLSPSMTEDAATGAPVAEGQVGEIKFWVRALDCSGAPAACETLMFMANFDLGRAVSPSDYRLINNYNDSQVFGRAYIVERRNQIGVDYVVELSGGVTVEHLTENVSRWTDVIAAFIEEITSGSAGS